MNPCKEAGIFIFVEPLQSTLQCFLPFSLNRIHAHHFEFGKLEIIEIFIETLGNSPTTVENESADDPACVKSGSLQCFRKRLRFVIQIKSAIIADSVHERINSGHDGGMSRKG